MQDLIFTNDVGSALDSIVAALKPSKTFILVDVNTSSYVLPRLQAMSQTAAAAAVIVTKAGDMHKNVDSLQYIWKMLGDQGATRDALLINIGGGVVTDMGAFAAATFKRGITFINMPTTLLGAVDASVGGKTGINFNNLKNEIGVFRQADNVIISTIFFNTLNVEQLRSGYAEMIKHALISSADELDTLLSKHVEDIDPDDLLEIIRKSVLIKKDIVDTDPTESDLRRALNLGHTAGHAFEALALERKAPIPHGYAVAYGLITAMVLSHMLLKFPSATLHRVAGYLREVFGAMQFTCDDYPRLLELMGHDKKNHTAGTPSFTLLEDIGRVRCGVDVSDDDLRTALDITRDLMGV